MISPELLRRFPFFARLNAAQLKTLAMLADEIYLEAGHVLFEENQPADTLYLLVEGEVDLYYISEDKLRSKARKEFLVGEINPEEIFGISAIIEPNIYTSTCRAANKSRLIKFDSRALREKMDQDCSLGYVLAQQAARAALQRLNYTRVQLAAAWA